MNVDMTIRRPRRSQSVRADLQLPRNEPSIERLAPIAKAGTKTGTRAGGSWRTRFAGALRATLDLALFSTILRSRLLCVSLLTFSALLVGFQIVGAPLWTCPLNAATGLDCPGCGLTRALAALAEGRWEESLATHPLAVCFLAAWLATLTATVISGRWREKTLATVERVEAATGLDAAFTVAFLLHGATRLGTQILQRL